MNVSKLTTAIALALAAAPALAADIVLVPPTNGAVTIMNAANSTTRFRVGENGSVYLYGTLEMPGTSTASLGTIYKGASPFLSSFGTSNVFLGANSGNFTLTSSGNSALGDAALQSLTTGGGNTAIGHSALLSNAIGAGNVAVGSSALVANVEERNTAVGFRALFGNTTGTQNTAVGYSALSANVDGDNNIAVGERAGVNITGNGNIAIGNDGVAGENVTIRIGTTNYLKAFIGGIRGRTTGSANAVAVVVDSNGQLGTISSSASTKDDIADMDDASSDLMKLRPVTFHYKADQDPEGRTLQYGLVAEEVAEVYPGLIARSSDGEVETVMYQFLPSMLLNEFQKQQRELAALRAELAEIKQALRRQP